jgi:diguanylate cyclase (GGDEF)-like protein/PAS domain S-box-containing protein
VLSIRQRMLGSVALGLAAALLTPLGPERVKFGISIAVAGVAYQAVLHLLFRRTREIPPIVAFTDVVICMVFPLLLHRSFLPAIIVALGVVAQTTIAVGRRWSFAAHLFGSAGFALVGLLIGSPNTWMVLAFLITGCLVVANIGSVADNESASRARYLALVEGLQGIVWEGDQDTFGFTYVSPKAETILGYPMEDWYQDGFWEGHLHPDDREEASEFCRSAEAAGRDHELEYRMISASGKVVHLHDVVAVTTDPNSRSYTVHGVMLDVTERKRIEQRERQYADIVETIDIGLVVLQLRDPEDDLSLEVVAANPAACAALDRPLDQFAGQALHVALPNIVHSGLMARVADVARHGRSFEIDEIVLRKGQPTEQILACRVFPLDDGVVGISLSDVTTETLASQALRRQALHDGLTGLPNRTLLQDRLTQSLRESSRSGAPVALLVMDLDQFKEINDALGHHVGDQVLIELANRLQQLVRGADVIARLGGDEFALLMTTDVSIEGAVQMAQRIMTALVEPFVIGELRLQTNASIGIAVHPEHGTDAESLTQRADVAMYQAKRSGSGHAIYKAELDRSSVRRLTLLSELRRALDRNEFVLHYQPIIQVATGEVVRAEALVRWEHPEQGLLGPDQFIDLAEVSGFIQPLTRWVVRQAATTAMTWWPAGHRVGVAVNLSVRNLYDPDLPVHAAKVLAETGLPAQLLSLEVTESELMDDPAVAHEVLTAINKLGVATSVDDFGTGYSSLTYLRNLPIREIKIDRSFISGMTTSADDLTIVRSTIDLGHNLSLEVVAEGVEDPLTLLRLGTLGCDLAQGFHISPPLPEHRFREWLDKRRAEGQTPLAGEDGAATSSAAPDSEGVLDGR